MLRKEGDGCPRRTARRPRYDGPVRPHLPHRSLAALALATLAACGGGRELVVADLEGRPVDALPAAGSHACWIFVAPDCPIANGFAPEIRRIAADFAPRGVRFALVYADPAFAAEDVRRHVTDFGYELPAWLDPEGRLVRHAGATVTPEAAVVAPDGEVLYRGRIDDRYADFGKLRAAPTTRDLRAALAAVLAGRQPDPRVTEAIGCFLPDS